MAKAVFFDRDGVLNQAVVIDGICRPPDDAASMIVPPEAAPCLARLRAAGFLCICVTNQPDFARGIRSLENIEAMNARILRELPLDDLFVCLHDGKDRCDCRKPRPGMLLAAAQKWDLDLGSCWMVGDRNTDIEAGAAAGCRTIFLDKGHERSVKGMPSAVCEHLDEVVAVIEGATQNN